MAVIIESVKGDIAKQPDLDAVVNAANADLVMGGGVAGALHRKAGPQLEEESKRLGPIKPGNAVITKAYNLPNKFVIHCLGPVYGRDEPEAELLADCYKNALSLADKNRVNSIGFPAISTGAFGYPPQEAAKIAGSAVKEIVPELKKIKKIRFVLYSQLHLDLYQKIFNR